MATSESRFCPIPITFPPLDRLGLAGAHLTFPALQSHQKPSVSSDSALKFVVINSDMAMIAPRRHLSRLSTENPASALPHHHFVDVVHLSLNRSTDMRTSPRAYDLATHTGYAPFQSLSLQYPACHCERFPFVPNLKTDTVLFHTSNTNPPSIIFLCSL